MCWKDDPLSEGYLEIERWVALAFFDSAAAAEQLAHAVKGICEPGRVAARFRVSGLASALSTPLAGYGELVAYAKGVEALQAGEPQWENLLGRFGDHDLTVGAVTLRSPRALLREMGHESITQQPPETHASDEKVAHWIFGSASVKDHHWLARLQELLRSESGEKLMFWHNPEASGWTKEAQRALDHARVAVVILSPEYTGSRYLMSEELFNRIHPATQRGLQIAWFCSRHCDWGEKGLSHPVLNPSTPLETLTDEEQREALRIISSRILDVWRGDRKTFEESNKEKTPGSIFVSYRRGDSTETADRLRELLTKRLGSQVFWDVDSIAPGSSWRELIEQRIRESQTVLVLIGPNWLASSSRSSVPHSKLHDKTDSVRHEITTALRHGSKIIPVLLNNAAMVHPSQLPRELSALARYQAIALRPGHWETDCEHLLELIQRETVGEEFTPENKHQLLESYAEEAFRLQSSGNLNEAFEVLKKQEMLCLELDNKDCLQKNYGNQAVILQASGRPDEAMDLHQKEQRLCLELGNKEGLQRSYGNQAGILRQWGQLDKAMALLKQQEVLCLEMGRKDGLQMSFFNQALVLQDWGRPEEAMALLQKQEALSLELGRKDGLQKNYHNQALILQDSGRLEEAMALRQREEALCRELDNKVGLARCYFNCGILSRMMNDSKAAHEKLDEALRLFSELKMPREIDAIHAEINKLAN